MIPIKGYKQVEYRQLQQQLNTVYDNSGKSHVEIAAEIKVTSANTIKNALNRDTQVASDDALTKVMDVLGVPGFIMYGSGKKYYYIKNK